MKKIRPIAARKGITPAQRALARMLAKGEDIAPIPGTRQMKSLEENIAAVGIAPEAADIAAIESAFSIHPVRGGRYPEAGMVGIDG